MRTVCIIQARMGSSRLPGKIMMDLNGKPVLWHVIERAKAAGRKIDQVMVATSTDSKDDIVEESCEKWGVPCHRGSELDVLSRYHEAAVLQKAERVIRITSDCPLLDSDVLSKMLDRWDELKDVDYLSNVIPVRTYPKGLDAEIFSFKALERAFKEAKTPHEREHVTPYIYIHPEKFNLSLFYNNLDMSHYRWTLDNKNDWELISKIYADLGKKENNFGMKKILKWFEEDNNRIYINQTDDNLKQTRNFSLRKVESKDSDLLLYWRNLLHVRTSMHTQHVITPNEHKKWFSGLNASSEYLIFENNNIPIGVLNFKEMVTNIEATWGFYIGWEDLPKGLGTAMCELGIKYAKDVLKLKKIKSEILDSNPKSIRLHKKLGFISKSSERSKLILEKYLAE